MVGWALGVPKSQTNATFAQTLVLFSHTFVSFGLASLRSSLSNGFFRSMFAFVPNLFPPILLFRLVVLDVRSGFGRYPR